MRNTAILDVGSSKVVCMIVEPEDTGAMIVRGTGSKEYPGYRFGELPVKRELYEAVRSAIGEAERAANTTVREITVGVPTSFMHVEASMGSAKIVSRNGRILSADVDNLIESSLSGEAPEGYTLIHSTPVSYVADRTPVSGSPIGLPCGVLSANISHCYVDESYRKMVLSILGHMGISADSFVSTALAAACFTVPEDIRARSVFLVDCGGSSTDTALLNGNAIVSTDVIPVGGRSFTNDLCFGLRLPESVADDLKRRYVFSLDYGDSCERVRIPGEGMFDIEYSTIQLIIESRAEELCALLAERLDACAPRDIPVWLVGSGLAPMRGAAEFVSAQIGRNVSVWMPKVTRNGSVSYASALGLADFALFRLGKSSAVKRTERFMRRAFDWRS